MNGVNEGFRLKRQGHLEWENCNKTDSRPLWWKHTYRYIQWEIKWIVYPKMEILSSFNHLVLFQTCTLLENKGSKTVFSQWCHRRTLLGPFPNPPPKNLSVNIFIFKVLWMLKVPHELSMPKKNFYFLKNGLNSAEHSQRMCNN